MPNCGLTLALHRHFWKVRAGRSCEGALPNYASLPGSLCKMLYDRPLADLYEEPSPPSDVRPQKRRLRRQRIIETAVPCALIAGVLTALIFTVGHVGANARYVERAKAKRAAMTRASMLQLLSEHVLTVEAANPAIARLRTSAWATNRLLGCA